MAGPTCLPAERAWQIAHRIWCRPQLAARSARSIAFSVVTSSGRESSAPIADQRITIRRALNGQKASALKLVRMLLCSPREEKKTAYIYCRDLAEPLTKLLQAALLGRFLQLFAEVALAD
jgi:hypothetical protein